MAVMESNFWVGFILDAGRSALADLGTSGLGWFVGLSIPITVALVKAFGVQKGYRLQAITKQWRSELRQTIAVTMGVFLLVLMWEAVWGIPQHIYAEASSLPKPSVYIKPAPVAPPLSIPTEKNKQTETRTAKAPIKINQIYASKELKIGERLQVRVNMQNISGVTFPVKFVWATYIEPLFPNPGDNLSTEERLWEQIIELNKRSFESDVTTGEDGLFNNLLETHPLEEAQVRGIEGRTLAAYFLLIYQDAKTGKDLVEVCGHISGPETFTTCAKHNKP